MLRSVFVLFVPLLALSRGVGGLWLLPLCTRVSRTRSRREFRRGKGWAWRAGQPEPFDRERENNGVDFL